MKSKFFFLIVIISVLLHQNVSAQHGIGIMGGMNFANLNIDPQDDRMEIQTRNGFLIGGILNIGISQLLSLQFEPSYMQKGAELILNFYEEGYTFKIEETVEAAYLDVPILLRATLQTKDVQPYLIGGFTLDFLLGDVNEVLNKITINGEDYTNEIPANEREQELKSNGFDLCVNFGGGLSIPMKSFTLLLEGQYSLGLFDMNDEQVAQDEVKTKIRNHGFQAKVGIVFPIDSN